MDRVEQYRRAAEDCRQMAERAHVQKHKDRWLRISDLWAGLAKDAEKDPSRSIPLVPEQPPGTNNEARFLVSSLLSNLSDGEKSRIITAGK
jgi:hypothetical protein